MKHGYGRVLVMAVAVVGVLAAGCASTSGGGARMDDSEISAGVVEALEDSALRKYDIGVATQDGVVTLSGEVDDELARDAAVAIAEGSPGVESVSDQLVVGKRGLSERGSDAWITTKITTKLAADPQVNPFRIRVRVNRGKVVLSGTVPTATTRDEAVKLAETVEGVTGVVSEIVVEGE